MKLGRWQISSLTGQLAAVLVTTIAVYILLAFLGRALENYRLEQRALAVKQEIKALEDQNKELKELVAYMSSDAYVEKVAREELLLAKPGETVLLPVPVTKPLTPSPADTPRPSPTYETNPASSPEPRWTRWWRLFFAPRQRP